MRFNPLWVLVFFLLISGMGVFLLPLLLIVAAAGALLMMGFSVASMLRLPRLIWRLLTDSRVRANFALAHATARLLRDRVGAPLNGYGSLTGFFIEQVSDENVVYETALQALARLKRGERKLVIYSEGRTFRILSCAILAVLLLVVLSGFGPAGAVLALVGGWFAAPVLSPWLQGFLLRNCPVERLSIQSAAFVHRTVSSFGGRFQSVEVGVEVFTSSNDTIEAELVDD